MKKGLIFFLGLLIVFASFASLPFLSAQTNATTEEQKVAEAYSCLNEKVSGNCATLSTEEKIFSLLSIGQCRSEVQSSAVNNECWSPSSAAAGACSLKTTSQAILALSSGSTANAKSWLISQNRTATDLSWYLQIESPEGAACSLTYSGLSYAVEINEDKTLSGNPGPGLSISSEGYWLQISPNFQDKEFEISCDKDFLTSLLFKKSSSSTIHVFPESSSAAAGGSTKEKIESSCFKENNVCNYEGSLWAAFVLDYLGEDISSYLPYLITFAEDNKRLLPDSFLYSVTQSDDYRVSLLSKQIGNKWWAASGSNYYDTALALQPFQGETLTEKTNAKQWLLDVQDLNGCWDSGNIRNTAFILSSVWSSYSSRFSGSGSGSSGDGSGAALTCEAAGNYCVSSGSCTGSIVSSDQSCAGFSSVCCTLPTEPKTCSELGGDLCSSGQVCSRGSSVSSADSTGETCCVGGFCSPSGSGGGQGSLSECEQRDGICRTEGTQPIGEESAPYECTFSSDVCYIRSSTSDPSPGSSVNWIWIALFLVLIALVSLGFFFQDKLRHLWLKIKSKFGKSGSPSHTGPHGRPPFPPYHHRPMPSRPIERRILPPAERPPRPHPPQAPRKPSVTKELDDVLKKLKEMSS